MAGRARKSQSITRRCSVELEDARAGRMTVQRYYLAPSYASAAPGEAEALDLLMRIAAIRLGEPAL